MRSVILTSLLCSLSPLFIHAWQLPDWHSHNFRTISEIYNLTVYPNNLALFVNGTNAVPAGLFNEAATGRISPIGTFNGFQDSIEYFFGLAPVAHSFPTNAVFESAQVVEFASACPNVASSTVYLTARAFDPGQPDNGVLVAYWYFDDHGAVLKYDAWIPNLNNWTALTQGLDATHNVQAQALTIQGVCGAVQQRCVGPNVQYSSVASCIAILSAKPYGDYDEVWGDNVVCRTIHLILTAIRPDVHCPHVGPTGGGKCVDIAYSDAYFNNDVALFGPRGAQTFMCPLNF